MKYVSLIDVAQLLGINCNTLVRTCKKLGIVSSIKFNPERGKWVSAIEAKDLPKILAVFKKCEFISSEELIEIINRPGKD